MANTDRGLTSDLLGSGAAPTHKMSVSLSKSNEHAARVGSQTMTIDFVIPYSTSTLKNHDLRLRGVDPSFYIASRDATTTAASPDLFSVLFLLHTA